ncbi:hypothetical protein DV711_06100 [Motiliproteus coralliicola]|uniref:Uncharacterized protein n=1 Tax=Motiliproteus coralliicola TaxID=2283196 RepID=A0A369WX64_9GAMM|nr:hypothetical protein [Motiliproteus coralliicola]RDE25126.1 hypothetical protein DV711_06100 [Motiliproteus coralliicola]
MNWAEKYLSWANNDSAAAQFLSHFFEVMQGMDDFADNDQFTGEVGERERLAARMIGVMLIEIPENPFYRANEGALRPVFAVLLHQWSLANKLARSNRQQDLVFAYVLRTISIQIATVVAHLTGGFDHANRVTEEAYATFYETDPETLESWVAEQQEIT